MIDRLPKPPEGLVIEGLKWLEFLNSGTQGSVFKAQLFDKIVVVKVQKSDRLQNAHQKLSFFREAAFLATINAEGLPKILDVGEFGDCAYLIEEFIDGVSLQTKIDQGPMKPDEIIQLAIELTLSLQPVHRAGYVHRDIKPKNILIDLQGRSHLIDFGLAIQALSARPENEVSGTLTYSSPEQNGSLDRPVDSRSDLYSLGITLYECVAGKPPFSSKDPGQLILHHAKTAPPDLTTDPKLSKIISKLILKDPDDRYFSTEELLKDLFPLSKSNCDVSLAAVHSAVSDQIFIGREFHLKTLKDLWSQAENGLGSVVLVEGASGMGKTKLVRELIKPLVNNDKVLILTGKCTQTGALIPFASLREAFDDFLSNPKNLNRENIQKLISAMGPNRSLLENFFPLLKDLAMESRSVNSLPTAMALEQFYSVLTEFLLALESTFESVLIFIDDVQWMDEATTVLLKYLSEKLVSVRILFVASIRNEFENEAARKKFIEAVRPALAAQIELRSFNEGDATQLISKSLGNKSIDYPLVKHIMVRSEGVPFAILQFLKMMLNGGALRPHRGVWQVNIDSLQSLNLPKNLFELVLKRLENVSKGAQEFLQVASLWGARFSTDIIFQSIPETRARPKLGQALVQEALSFGLIEARDENSYSFVHDRVQEALQSSVAPAELPVLHQRIADAIRALGLDQEFLYERVEHLRRGQYETNQNEFMLAATAAGSRALHDYAVQKGYEYFTWAHQSAIILETSISTESLREYAACAALVGRFEEARSLFSSFLERESDPLLRALAHYELGRIAVFRREIAKAWHHTVRGLSELGFWNEKRRAINLLHLIKMTVLGALSDFFQLKVLREKDPVKVNYLKMAARLTEVGGVAAYFLNDPWKFTAILFSSIYWSARLPACGELAFAQMAFATGVSVLGLKKLAFKYMAKANVVAAEIADPFLATRLKLYRVFVLQFNNQWIQSREEILNLLQNSAQYLDGQDFMNATNGGATCVAMLGGHQKESMVAVRAAEAFLLKTENDIHRRLGHTSLSTGIQVTASLGDYHSALEKIKHILPLVESSPDDHSGNLAFYGSLLGYYYETRETGTPVDDAIAKGLSMTPTPEFLCMPHFRFFYVFAGYCLLNRVFAGRNLNWPAETQKINLGKLKSFCSRTAYVGMMESWKPARAHLRIQQGALEFFSGNSRKALKKLNQAQAMADTFDLPWVHFEAHRWRAHILREQGLLRSSLVHARLALELSHRNAWIGKSNWIVKEFQMKSESLSGVNHEETSPVGWEPALQDLQRRRQFEALVNMSGSAIGLYDDLDHARKLLDESVKYFSPERALLFLVSDSNGLNNKECHFFVGRDSNGQDLTSAEDISQKALQTVLQNQELQIFTLDEAHNQLSSESVVAYNLRSVMVAPLVARGRLIGLLYLDNRIVKGIFRDSDRSFILSVASLFAASLESARSARLEIERADLQRDLELTGAIQKLLLPQKAQIFTTGIRVEGFLNSASQSSGDIWAADEVFPGTILALIGDVTGHGPGPAMVTATVAGAYQMFLVALKDSASKETSDSNRFDLLELEVSYFFKVLDENLQKTTRGDFLMPYTAALINQTGDVAIWGGGSPGVLLKALHDGKVEFLSGAGSPLGLGSQELQSRHRLKNFQGSLLFYSDGLLENLAQKRNPEMFLSQLFSKTESTSTLIEELKAKIPKSNISDDITVVAIEINSKKNYL